MPKTYPGGFVTRAPTTPSKSGASGMWTPELVSLYKASNSWPTGEVIIPPYVSPYYSFNGSTSYLKATQTALSAYNFGTGDFTIEFWIYPTTNWTSQTNPGVVGQKASDSDNGWVIYRNGGSNNMVIRMTGQNDFFSTSYPATNTWEHWAVTRNGSTMRWFRNGTLLNSDTTTVNIISTSGSLQIGKTETWGGFFNGRISNLRIVKGTALYTTNFTVPTLPLTNVSGTTLLTAVNTNIEDTTGTVTFTNYNGVTQTAPGGPT